MRLWSYGTSPHGLALTNKQFWRLTPRLYYALRDVQQAEIQRWAIQQAMFVNANISSDTEPYTADDFLGQGNRDKRIAERAAGQAMVWKENRKIATIRTLKPGEEEPEGLPRWAKMRADERAVRNMGPRPIKQEEPEAVDLFEDVA